MQLVCIYFRCRKQKIRNYKTFKHFGNKHDKKNQRQKQKIVVLFSFYNRLQIFFVLMDFLCVVFLRENIFNLWFLKWKLWNDCEWSDQAYYWWRVLCHMNHKTTIQCGNLRIRISCQYSRYSLNESRVDDEELPRANWECFFRHWILFQKWMGVNT